MENILKGLDLSEEDLNTLEAVLDVPAEQVDSAFEQAKSILQGVLVSKSDETATEFLEAFLAEKAVEPTDEPEQVDEYVEFRARVMEDLNVEGLQNALSTLNNRLTTIEQSIETLGTEVKAVKVDEDTKIASMIAAPNWAAFVNSKQEAPEEDEEKLLETLKGNIPEYKETEYGKENPLELGFTRLMWGQ